VCHIVNERDVISDCGEGDASLEHFSPQTVKFTMGSSNLNGSGSQQLGNNTTAVYYWKIFCVRSQTVIEECKALFNCPAVSETTITRKYNFLHKYTYFDNELCKLMT